MCGGRRRCVPRTGMPPVLRGDLLTSACCARDYKHPRVRGTPPSSLSQKRGNGNPRPPHMGRKHSVRFERINPLPLATLTACAAVSTSHDIDLGGTCITHVANSPTRNVVASQQFYECLTQLPVSLEQLKTPLSVNKFPEHCQVLNG